MDLVLLRGYVYTLWRLCFKKKQIPRGKESTKNLLLLVTFFPSSTFTFALVFPYRSSCVIFLDNKVAKKFRKLLFRDKIKKATFIHFFSLSLLLSLAHRYSSIHENTIFQTSSYLNINSNRKMSQKGKKKLRTIIREIPLLTNSFVLHAWTAKFHREDPPPPPPPPPSLSPKLSSCWGTHN